MNPPGVITGTMDDLALVQHKMRLHAYSINPDMERAVAQVVSNDVTQLRKDAEKVDLQVRVRIGQVLLDAVETPQQQRSQGWTEAVMVLTNCYCGLRGDTPRN